MEDPGSESATSFRRRTSSHEVARPSTDVVTNDRAPGQHTITIGAPDATAVELLEAVPKDKQILLEYCNLDAWVPNAAPVGSTLIPGLPKFALPAFMAGKAKEGAEAEQAPQSRQVRSASAVASQLFSECTTGLANAVWLYCLSLTLCTSPMTNSQTYCCGKALDECQALSYASAWLYMRFKVSLFLLAGALQYHRLLSAKGGTGVHGSIRQR